VLQYHSLRVVGKRPETDRATAVTFEVSDELRANFHFIAGQHIGLRARVNGEELRRTYSICSTPSDPWLEICVRLIPGGRFSRYVAEELREGDSLDVLMPNGSFHATTGTGHARTFVAFAAGIGITPVLSILRDLLETDNDSRALLFYGSRDGESVLFTEELQALKDRYLTRFALHFLLSAESQEIDLYNGRLDAAKLESLTPLLFDARAVDEYFICGPGSMTADLSAALIAKGVEPAHIHSEHFLVTEARPAAAAAAIPATKAASGRARVAVRIDGRTRSFEMPMDGTSVLDAAAEAGLDLPFSCRAGVCSTCRTLLVKGKVEMHSNYALEQWELDEGFILACQAHPLTQELELTYDSR
jgi:ring-1,2-phenylacetyl-CoA epoxidase subunit PaaE